jgi:Ca2+-binding EF-hand superfamily protein
MPTKEELLNAFRTFDLNGDGVIDLNEFVRVLSMPAPGGNPMPPERAEKIFRRTDKDGVSFSLSRAHGPAVH